MLRVCGVLQVLLSLACLFSSIQSAFATEPEIAQRWQSYVLHSSLREIEADLARDLPHLKPIPADPQLLKRAHRLVRHVDQAYRKLFPKLMSNKALADFVIVKSNDLMDTMTINDVTSSTAPTYRGYLVLPQIILNTEYPERDGKIIGVVAHELAHLYLHHTYVERLVLDAWEEGSSEKLPAQKMMNFRMFLSDAYVAGHGFDEVWSGLPAGTSVLQNVLVGLVKQLNNDFPNAQCVKTGNQMLQDLLFPILSKSYSYFEWRNIFASDLQKRISAAMIDSFQQHIVTCSHTLGFKSTVLQNMRFPNSLMTIDAARYIEFRLGRQFQWADQNEFELLFELGRKIQHDMRRTISAGGLETIRWRSFEDEADDFALAIMRELGSSVESYTNGLLGLLDALQPGTSLTCRSAIASGQPVPYGGLDDPHHAVCYRVKDLERRFAEALPVNP